MNAFRHPKPRADSKGFSLIELLVAVAITSILVVLVAQITGGVLKLWPYGRDRSQTNVGARVGLEILAQDLKACVMRPGVKSSTGLFYGWLDYRQEANSIGPTGYQITKTPFLMFLSTPFVHEAVKNGTTRSGDLCAVAYRLGYQDPIDGSTGVAKFQAFGLYRKLFTPEFTLKWAFAPTSSGPITLTSGQNNLYDNFWNKTNVDIGAKPMDYMLKPENFLVANVINLSVSFISEKNGVRTQQDPTKAVLIGNALMVDGVAVPGAKVVMVDISMTILTEKAAKRLAGGAGASASSFVPGESLTYYKRVELPRY